MEKKKATKRTAKKAEKCDGLAEVQEILKKLSADCAALQKQVGINSGRISAMETVDPPELRKLTKDTVAEAVAADSYAKFEVLYDFHQGSQVLREGSIIRADMFESRGGSCRLPHLVERGLCLGVPTGQDEALARIKAATEARIQAAKAETAMKHADEHKEQAAQAMAHASAILDEIPKD